MSFSEILGDMENDNAIERDSKHLATIAALRAENDRLMAERNDWKTAGLSIAVKLVSAGFKASGIVDGVAELITARDTYREIAGELHRDALEVYTRVPYEHETAGLKSAMDKLSTTLARWTEIEGGKG